MMGKHGASRPIKTADTIFGIIKILTATEQASLTELADELDIPRSTLHSHLATLVNHEYLVKEDKKYRLSLKFLNHGARARENNPLYDISAPILDQVADQTDEIVWLVAEEYGKVVCLRKAEGKLAIQPYKKVGSRLTMHNIAAGKAILAKLSEEHVDEIIGKYGLPKYTENTITDPDELFEELEAIRETGVAFNDGESMEGFRAVASPICLDDEPHGSIVVSGPKQRMRDRRFREEIPEIISGAANAIALKLMSRSQ